MSWWSKVKADVAAQPGRKATAKDFVVSLLLEPGFQLAFLTRLHEVLRPLPLVGPVLSRLLWVFTRIWTACDVSPRCVIGRGVYFPHPTGVVIGAGVVIGENVKIYQGVTLGRLHEDTMEKLTVGDFACLYAGAKVFGDVTIGERAVVGANAVVLKPVPAGAIAVGVPAVVKTPKPAKR